MFLLDTNILIHYAAGELMVVDFLKSHDNTIFYLPSIVAIEFLSYPKITPEAVFAFQRFAHQTIMVNLDFPIAERAAEIRRKHSLKLADAVIAASALATNSTLVTRNVRDFKKVTGLSTFSP